MDPILIKRFLKYNKSLVAVIGVTLLVVLFLLVIAILKYLEMIAANNEVNKMRDTINELQDPQRNKVAVIAGNLDRLKEDYKVYDVKNAVIRPYFGNPYGKALDAMAKKLGWKNGDEIAKRFYDFYAAANEHLYDRYKRFQMIHNTADPKNGITRGMWDRAMAEFVKEAQKVSFEKIVLNDNADDIFLQAIGMPREMAIRAAQDLLKKMDIRFNTFVLDKNVDIGQYAADFALSVPTLNTPDKIAESMMNMEIMGDMISRLVKYVPADRNKRYLKSIDVVKYNGCSEYNEDRRIKVYKYQIKFTGTMEALRKVIGEYNRAIADSRVYVLRNLKLSVPLKDDPAAVVIGLVEAPVLLDKDGKKIEIKFRDESNLAYNLRRDYGKVLIGNNSFFEITMELDYMILKQREFQRR